MRPHEALRIKRPADVYVLSRRKFREGIEAYEYDGQYHMIKVNSCGYVCFDSWQIYLSETKIGQHIEFRPALDGETFVVCYRNFKIAEFDTQTGQLLSQTIARL